MTASVHRSSASSVADPAFAALLEEVANKCLAGEAIDWPAYERDHPEHVQELRQLMPAIQAVADLSRSAINGDAASITPVDAVEGTLGDFRILREVGRGGMGIVYEAEQMSLQRRVALKVLPFAGAMDSRQLQRFKNESMAAAQLHHTNIVPVHYVGCERGVHFYAMQYIEGQSLAGAIAQIREKEHKASRKAAKDAKEDLNATADFAPSRLGVSSDSPAGSADAPTPPVAALSTLRTSNDSAYFRTIAELGIQAAEALDYAHENGITHRDIKPANLLVDADSRLWVTDFGLAQVQGDARMTMTGDLVGTLRYMSPEQALAKRVVIDHRTDIYSLGATLYELLTLQPAFSGTDRQELLRQIAFEEPRKPRKLNRSIPLEPETIVLKALEKNPADRYATARELADDLRHYLEDRPIRARQPTLLQRARKWARRHRAAVWSAATILIVSSLVLAGTLGWEARDRAARRLVTEEAVGLALHETQHWQEERRIPDALSAARRAEGIALAGPTSETVLQRVRARVADLQLLVDLENVRLEMTNTTDEGRFDTAGADELYAQEFRKAGLDLETLPVEEAAERIRGKTVATELSAVLDYWAFIRLGLRGPEDPKRTKFYRVACLVDPDTRRMQAREALHRAEPKALLAAVPGEVTDVPVATLYVLGFALSCNKQASLQAEAFLRKAQSRYPDDFWLNHNLYRHLRDARPPRREEAVRFAAMAVALRPGSPGAHLNLGTALRDNGRLTEAIGEFREALRIKEDYAEAHRELASTLKQQGELEAAIAECLEALRYKKDFAEAHVTLGNALLSKHRPDEAIKEYGEAIRLKPDYPTAHCNLGIALQEKGRLEDAIKEYRKAIDLDKDLPDAHNNLGSAVAIQGRLDDAIDEFREAIRLTKDHAEAHFNLGTALFHKGRLDEAMDEYREAIRIKKDHPDFHCNLGVVLNNKGRFDDAVAEYREAIRLKKGYPRARDYLGQTERLIQLDAMLPKVLSRQVQTNNASDRAELAGLCQQYKGLYVVAVRLYCDAFAADPALAEKLGSPASRYDAACAAALAGCGQGNDADQTDDKERARLRRQALDWLRADLAAYRQLLAKEPDKIGPVVNERMQQWLADKDFVHVRGSEALDKLPEAERREWQKLWSEVEELRQKVAKPAK
jgi:serine/threonine protein kinase/Flp pilus assembly protein TadD